MNPISVQDAVSAIAVFVIYGIGVVTGLLIYKVWDDFANRIFDWAWNAIARRFRP